MTRGIQKNASDVSCHISSTFLASHLSCHPPDVSRECHCIIVYEDSLYNDWSS
jgi:hypothetical protein